MKFKNLKQLKAAYDSGELTKKTPLTLDNDRAFVYIDNPKNPEGDLIKVFYIDEPPEAGLLEEALNLLGIPFENA